MTKLTTLENVSLKKHPAIKEDIIQQYIFEHPEVLGLGDLSPIRREKKQPSGGRLDILLESDDGVRYEVEIQLGDTDPEHIIRTIEYWDTERKRYPQYEHYPVIVAENVTGRFFNVISLFNGVIPLIALQMNAVKSGDAIALNFTKVLDKQTMGTEEEDQNTPTDRPYWEKKSTPKMLKSVDSIFAALGDLVSGYELKYNKFYIGVTKDGIAKNFVMFRPHKSYLYFVIQCQNDADLFQKIENAGLEYTYKTRWNECYIKLDSVETYKTHKELLDNLVKIAKEYRNADD